MKNRISFISIFFKKYSIVFFHSEAWIGGKLDSDSTVGNVDWVDGETSDVDGGNAPDLWAEDEPTGVCI